MTTILTVHGTGATGPETGETWWQKGSPFEAKIREMVKTDDGELIWQPVIWDGANSETSRRAAGRDLYQKMQALEARGEPYSVIGHSHGGSVISAALIEGAAENNKLDHMKGWLTIGTPFIQTKKDRFLFDRLGLFGKAVYMALISIFLIIILGVVFDIPKMTSNDFGELIAFALIMLVPFLLFYSVLHYFDRKKSHLYRKKTVLFAKDQYRSRWLALWHKNDEAVQGLKSLKALNIDIFAKNFAISPISLLSVFILPVLLLAIVGSPANMKNIHHKYFANKSGEPITRSTIKLRRNGENVIVNIRYFIGVLDKKILPVLLGKASSQLNIYMTILIMVLLVTSILITFSLVITFLFGLLAKAVSSTFSRGLNPLTMSQIRSTALGSDTAVDSAVDAQVWPMWLEEGHPPLPDKLGNNLQAYSDAAAAKAIPKFRSAAATFAMASDAEAKTDILSEYLTWDELIHTSYFTNPYFCKLMAYSLTQADGFEATIAFQQDPYYAVAAVWYEEITRAKPVHLSSGGISQSELVL